MKEIYSIGSRETSPTVILSVLLKHNISHLYDLRKSDDTKCASKYLENLFTHVKNLTYQRIPKLAFSNEDLCPEFEEDEFQDTSAIEKLCGTIARQFEIQLLSEENTIEWLNELLQKNDLLNIVLTGNAIKTIPQKIQKLVKKTEKHQKKPYDRLTRIEQITIERLNRLLLEELCEGYVPKMGQKKWDPFQKTDKEWDPSCYLERIGEVGIKLAKNLIDEVPAPCFLSSEKLSEVNFSVRKVLIDKAIEGNKEHYTVEHLNGKAFYKELIKGLPIYKGKVYDLRNAFHKINRDHFAERFKPDDIIMTWEKRGSSLGFYRYPDYIGIAHFLDKNFIPEAVIDAVMYHELLHLQRSHEGLPWGHTQEFYFDEALFKKYAEMFGLNVKMAMYAVKKGMKE